MFDNLSQLAVFDIAVSWGLCTLIWLVQTIIYCTNASSPAKTMLAFDVW